MNKSLVIALCAVCAGCSTLSGGPLKSLTRIEQVQPGMSRDEVSSILGNQVVVGYEITDPKQGATKSIVISNPQKTETLTRDDKSYEVVYYFTHIVKADGIITNDELTPLIFEDGRLAGKGWVYLKKIRKQ